MDFRTWMQQVDSILAQETGFTSEDLPDYCYMDSFQAGEEPKETAMEVLAESGYGEDFNADCMDDDSWDEYMDDLLNPNWEVDL